MLCGEDFFKTFTILLNHEPKSATSCIVLSLFPFFPPSLLLKREREREREKKKERWRENLSEIWKEKNIER